jgi:hypothetical protein
MCEIINQARYYWQRRNEDLLSKKFKGQKVEAGLKVMLVPLML